MPGQDQALGAEQLDRVVEVSDHVLQLTLHTLITDSYLANFCHAMDNNRAWPGVVQGYGLSKFNEAPKPRLPGQAPSVGCGHD